MAFNNKVVHGKHYKEDKIKFTGEDTQGIRCWRCSGDTYKEIYDWLVEHEVITTWDENPVDKYLLDKLGKTYEDYINEDEEFDINQLYIDGNKFLTDEAYYEIISEETGNAYYQEWEIEKLWYAVLSNNEDNDWGTGSFDESEARRMMNEYNQRLEANGLEPESYIAVIDANYDKEGNPTSDAICIEEIY